MFMASEVIPFEDLRMKNENAMYQHSLTSPV